MLTGTVRDSAGNTGSVAINVTVGNGPAPTPLTASFTSPAAGATVTGTVSVGMAVSGSTAASRTFQLSVDGTTVSSQTVTATTASFAWNTTAVANGSHTLGLTVTDSAGRSGSASRTLTVSNATTGSLIVYITQPSPGQTVSGINWAVLWVDNAAAGSKTYTLSVAGATVGGPEVTTSAGPVSIPWNTAAVGNGTQMLTGTVRDSAGNTGSVAINVVVQNP
jgi:hypothetical protein